MHNPFKQLIALTCAATLFGGSLALAAGNPQTAAASKTAKFSEAPAKDAAAALDAKALDEIKKQTGKEAQVKGKVDRLFVPKGGKLVILNFAKDYKSAISAVVFKESFAVFPDLTTLEGKDVLISGQVVDYQGRPEIKLRKLDQIKLIKK